MRHSPVSRDTIDADFARISSKLRPSPSPDSLSFSRFGSGISLAMVSLLIGLPATAFVAHVETPLFLKDRLRVSKYIINAGKLEISAEDRATSPCPAWQSRSG